MGKGGFGRKKNMVDTKIDSVCRANVVARYKNNTFESGSYIK